MILVLSGELKSLFHLKKHELESELQQTWNYNGLTVQPCIYFSVLKFYFEKSLQIMVCFPFTQSAERQVLITANV